MSEKAFTPYIHVDEKSVTIIGESKGLDALGDMLKLKARLGEKMSATFTDGANKLIRITSSDEFMEGKTI